jgi:hypothetical protein
MKEYCKYHLTPLVTWLLKIKQIARASAGGNPRAGLARRTRAAAPQRPVAARRPLLGIAFRAYLLGCSVRLVHQLCVRSSI